MFWLCVGKASSFQTEKSEEAKALENSLFYFAG